MAAPAPEQTGRCLSLRGERCDPSSEPVIGCRRFFFFCLQILIQASSRAGTALPAEGPGALSRGKYKQGRQPEPLPRPPYHLSGRRLGTIRPNEQTAEPPALAVLGGTTID